MGGCLTEREENMGLLDLFFHSPQVPAIQTILPAAAKQEILNGRLPILRTDKIFFKRGEMCHYIDKAIYEKRSVKKRYIRQSYGSSYKGLILKDVRHHYGGGKTDVVDNIQYDRLRGILYLTNQRIIFVGEQEGFDKRLDELVATTAWSNCIELQFQKESYRIFVPDGNVINKALHLVR